MYVCICNALTERRVTQSIRSGARSPAAVYRDAGVRPRCGKCVEEIRRMLPQPAPDGGAMVCAPAARLTPS